MEKRRGGHPPQKDWAKRWPSPFLHNPITFPVVLPPPEYQVGIGAGVAQAIRESA